MTDEKLNEQPGEETPTEEVETPTETPEETPKVEDTPSGDPLDEIQDVEVLRDKAKGFRSAAQRAKKPKEETPKDEPVEEIPEEETGQYVTKKDLGKVATNEAKGLVSDEVKEVWDDLMKIPLAGADSLDARSIAKNMTERFAIYNARNPETEHKPDVSGLKETMVKAGTGSGVTPKKKAQDPPNFRLPKKPEDWY